MLLRIFWTCSLGHMFMFLLSLYTPKSRTAGSKDPLIFLLSVWMSSRCSTFGINSLFHSGENIMLYHYNFNLHFSYKNDFEKLLKDLVATEYLHLWNTYSNLMSLIRARVRENGRSGLYWFVVLYIYWMSPLLDIDLDLYRSI